MFVKSIYQRNMKPWLNPILFDIAFQVELVQCVIDGVNYLIDCEKKLEKGQDITIPPPVAQFKK